MDLHAQVAAAVMRELGGQRRIGSGTTLLTSTWSRSPLQLAHAVDAELEIVEQAAGERRELSAGRGERDLAGRAREQFDADEVLDALDRAGKHRRRQFQRERSSDGTSMVGECQRGSAAAWRSNSTRVLIDAC
jgi:hypothetical protein